ncbi:hypothetical protein [Sphingomonas sp.]|jgi:hypothetical protein|uniref:hypothetical protein n=1 Tax=Sphingomonas sp. TaxID=28214 RepID=UPI002DBC2DE4|nr:hypothetical protein [Sphingomonas sp.]HEU4968385.1 hypothetical protein [Sphingomonas sp.]
MAMNAKHSDDPTESERRKNLSEEQIEDLELAGGVEGGMQAGSAGGPAGDEARAKSTERKPAKPQPKR